MYVLAPLRTTCPEQQTITHEIFNQLDRNGLIFAREVVQPWCAKDQRFLADRFVLGMMLPFPFLSIGCLAFGSGYSVLSVVSCMVLIWLWIDATLSVVLCIVFIDYG